MARVRTLTHAHVVSTHYLTPAMVRVVLGGPDGARLPIDYPGDTDSYVKLLLPRPESGVVAPFDPEVVKAELDPELWPVMRTYTIRHWDEQRGQMALDFVVHGDKGIAGPWAVQAEPGDAVQFFGPGSGYRPDPAADWHLLVGDESALPAVAEALAVLAPEARATVLLEVADAAEEQEMPTRADVTVHWLHRDGSGTAPGIALVDAVRALDFSAGRVHAFVHGDATFVREVRSFLRFERDVPRGDLSASGYWRRGMDDEAWRAAKKEWAAAVEADEQAHAVGAGAHTD